MPLHASYSSPDFPNFKIVTGLHLYIGSSLFVRHTLNALYSDLRVEIRRVRVHGPQSKTPGTLTVPRGGSSHTYISFLNDQYGISSMRCIMHLGSPRGSNEGSTANPPISIESKRPRCVREKSFFVGLVVTGAGRVTGAHVQWEV